MTCRRNLNSPGHRPLCNNRRWELKMNMFRLRRLFGDFAAGKWWRAKVHIWGPALNLPKGLASKEKQLPRQFLFHCLPIFVKHILPGQQQ